MPSTPLIPGDILLPLHRCNLLVYLLQKIGQPTIHTHNLAIPLLRPKCHLSLLTAENDKAGVENAGEKYWLQIAQIKLPPIVWPGCECGVGVVCRFQCT